MTNNLKTLSVASGLIALLAGSSAAAFLISRYSNTTMHRVTLEDHSDSGEAIFTGQNVQFIRETDGTYSVDVDLEGQGAETQLVLQNIRPLAKKICGSLVNFIHSSNQGGLRTQQ